MSSVISTRKFSQLREGPRRTEKVRESATFRSPPPPPPILFIPRFPASSAYCSELKERLQARDKELEAGRAELLLLQEELRRTRSQLSEAQSKLELYAEREKHAGAVGREAEKVHVVALNL